MTSFTVMLELMKMLSMIYQEIVMKIFSTNCLVHIKFDSDANEIIFVGPMMETDEGNIIDYTTSMALKPPTIHKEMELIHAWVNNFDANPTTLIDWLGISISPINEYVT